MINVTVNGEPRDLPEGTTVAALLMLLKKDGQPAAVEVSKKLVPKREHAARVLVTGDAIEVVTLVGGG